MLHHYPMSECKHAFRSIESPRSRSPFNSSALGSSYELGDMLRRVYEHCEAESCTICDCGLARNFMSKRVSMKGKLSVLRCDNLQ